MASEKPPKPLKWNDGAAVPCVLNSAICFWIGTIHFVVSGGHADFVIVALIIVAFAPWLGHIFKSVGKEGIQFRDGGDSGSTETPPPSEGSGGQATNRSPEGTEPNAESFKPSFFNLSLDARKVLATLWRYQQIHFPPSKMGLWTFALAPNTPEFAPFLRGSTDLIRYNLAGVADNGQIALTLEGLAYCKDNSAVISGWEFTYAFQ